MAFVTQPPPTARQPPPAAYPTASGTAFEVPSLLMHPWGYGYVTAGAPVCPLMPPPLVVAAAAHGLAGGGGCRGKGLWVRGSAGAVCVWGRGRRGGFWLRGRRFGRSLEPHCNPPQKNGLGGVGGGGGSFGDRLERSRKQVRVHPLSAFHWTNSIPGRNGHTFARRAARTRSATRVQPLRRPRATSGGCNKGPSMHKGCGGARGVTAQLSIDRGI